LKGAGGADNLVVIGRILRPHGIKGEVKVDVITDWPGRFSTGRSVFVNSDNKNGSWRVIENVRFQNTRLIIKFKGVESRDSAEVLKNHWLEIRANERPVLKQDEYYLPDLLGSSVRLADGNNLGMLKDVMQDTSQDLYVIETDRGDVLVPAVKAFIKKIDLSQRIIIIDPVEGLLGTDED